MKDVSLYRCLANPTRLAVLKQLRDGTESCVTDLVAATGSEQTNLSHHLATLSACGLVESRRDGKRVRYRLAHAKLAPILDEVETLAAHIEASDPNACADGECC